MLHIVVDTREKDPLRFEGWPDVVCSVGTLPTGDYSLLGLSDRVAIERKTLIDVVNCFSGTEKGRFERELSRARGLDYFAVVIEGSYAEMEARRYRSKLTPSQANKILLDLQVRYRSSFVWAGNRRAAEFITYWLLRSYLDQTRDQCKSVLAAYGDEHV